MAEVILKNVSKSFGKIKALQNVSVEVKDGEFLIMLGPTGAGKTTTLRIVSGLEEPDRGEVFIAGKKMNGVPPRDRNCAFVFQNYILYPHMSVYDNLAFPLRSRLHRVEEEEIKRRIEKVASTLKIKHLLKRKPDKLSGGEQQRVALGRAMVRNPQVFLMDEPLSNLDAKLREEMRVELKSIQQNLGATFFYVTHDHVEAMTLGDRIVVLNQGHVMQVGTPDEIYRKPQNLFVAKFVGNPEINLLQGRVAENSLFLEEIGVSIPLEKLPALVKASRLPDKILTGVRPEDILLRSSSPLFEGEVYLIEDLGTDKIVRVKAKELVLRSRVPTEEEYTVGEKVAIAFQLENLVFFDALTEKAL